jgi:hypothetical protein
MTYIHYLDYVCGQFVLMERKTRQETDITESNARQMSMLSSTFTFPEARKALGI